MDNQDQKHNLQRRNRLRLSVELAGLAIVACVVSASAIVIKEGIHRSRFEPLAKIDASPMPSTVPVVIPTADELASIEDLDAEVADVRDPMFFAQPPEPKVEIIVEEPSVKYAESFEIRYFNGRPVRPARTITMVVTAYSPDEQSCGDSADGITSSLHSVWSNGMKMVAADSKVLPLGSMITVPGYDNSNIVPVLDRGGAIKGNRLDVLYPTHEIARKWGVKRLKVTVWEYADGRPADDFRAIRDSRN